MDNVAIIVLKLKSLIQRISLKQEKFISWNLSITWEPHDETVTLSGAVRILFLFNLLQTNFDIYLALSLCNEIPIRCNLFKVYGLYYNVERREHVSNFICIRCGAWNICCGRDFDYASEWFRYAWRSAKRWWLSFI